MLSMRNALVGALFLTPVFFCGVHVSGQTKIMASDAGAYDLFGTSVAMSGNTAIVGANSNDDAGQNSGSAYVYVNTGSRWIQQSKLTAAFARPLDQFGTSVAISGDTVIIGAPSDDDDAPKNEGSVYVFTRMGSVWTQQAQLFAGMPQKANQFGFSVAISGNTIVVGSPLESTGAAFSGSAYVFTREGSVWRQQAHLTASDAGMGDSFGFSVSLSGDTAVVGALLADGNAGINQGSAYIFNRTGTSWAQQAKITTADAAVDDRFGFPVSIERDTVIIGSHLDDDAGYNSGSVYVFERTGAAWTQADKLTASDAAVGQFFGRSLAVRGDVALVGSFADNGSVYIFKHTSAGWVQKAKMTSFDNTFGYSMAVWDSSIIVGANRGGTPAVEGAVYMITIGSCLVDLNGADAVKGTVVDGADLGLLVQNWGKPGISDINNDGTTNGTDLGFLLYAWGPCPK
jgi:FG-GAP repeat protein